MSNLDKISYGFVAGEVSPSFYGRSDLTKYDLGLAECRNYFVDYRGGIVSRAGTRFVGEVMLPSSGVKLFRFRALVNDYILVFGENYLRFVRSGGYVLESAKTISSLTAASPAVITSVSHGYSTGDWIYISSPTTPLQLGGRYYSVTVLSADTFSLQNLDESDFDTTTFAAYVSGASAQRVYTIATPYGAADLKELRAEQKYSEVVLTHLNHSRRKLVYTSDTSWAISLISTTPTTPAPGAPTLVPSAAGTAGVAVGITALINGQESRLSPYTLNELSVNYTTTAGSLLITWPPVAGATEYYVYRSLVLPVGAEISKGQELGFLGRALTPQFTDNNVVPDFTKTPPEGIDPFTNSGIEFISVTAGGAGYTKGATVTVVGPPGTGFSGYPVVNSAGAVVSIVVVNPGSGYVSPTVTVSGGAGAAFTVTLTPASGNNPRLFRTFQQRGIYAGTMNNPMTLWASRPGEPNNFDTSSIITAGDGYSFTLDAADVQPIYHLLTLRNGLLAFTASSVTMLRAEEGKAISGVNALAEPQAYKGASLCPPATIDLDVLFAQSNSSAINAMMYTEYTSTFQLQDVSMLSSHLLGETRQVTRMEWVSEPDKLLYCLREDGALLSLTYERPQEVFGWAKHFTRGYFKDCCAVHENGREVLYVVVERFIENRWTQFIERQESRRVDLLEDVWAVDAGLSYPHLTPTPTLTFAAASGLGVTVTASAAVFDDLAVGDIIYAEGGKAEITAIASPTSATIDYHRAMVVNSPEDTGLPRRVYSGNWSVATPTTTVSGLWHLEGERVSVLADGSAFTNLLVEDGAVTFDLPATKITVGLPYQCRAKTLPLTGKQAIVEHRVKSINKASIRIRGTRGLSIGTTYSDVVELKDRGAENWGEQLAAKTMLVDAPVASGWDTDAAVTFVQNYPLPAEILCCILDYEVGDV